MQAPVLPNSLFVMSSYTSSTSSRFLSSTTSYIESTCSLPGNTMPPLKPKSAFLSLPLEARLRIYEYIFIDKRQIIFYCKPPADHPIPPSILRTCKQIHKEACPILYSENTFLISEPERVLKWFLQIGRANIKLLNNIRIFVDPVMSTTDTIFGRRNEISLWYKLLDQLAREATGLRHVYIYWDTEEAWNFFGAGKDLNFVRELAKIQGLKSMVVDGYYAVHWPRYLAEQMGVPVQEGEHTASSLQDLRRFQRGTENLVP